MATIDPWRSGSLSHDAASALWLLPSTVVRCSTAHGFTHGDPGGHGSPLLLRCGQRKRVFSCTKAKKMDQAESVSEIFESLMFFLFHDFRAYDRSIAVSIYKFNCFTRLPKLGPLPIVMSYQPY